MRTLQVIDSHTEGEPTRVVIAGGPDLGDGDVAERLQAFRRYHDAIRSAVVQEPRGFDALVGALLLEPTSPDAVAGMIFFNNADTLHMCGHGTIGVAATLQHLGRITAGRHRLESSVGPVEIELHDDGSVSVDNVFSYRHRKQVEVDLGAGRTVRGDIAWGGNWFFLIGPDEHRRNLDAAHLNELLDFTSDV
ncbi:MAG: proline racemase family protein, partial [Acidobacteriota bacterium]